MTGALAPFSYLVLDKELFISKLNFSFLLNNLLMRRLTIAFPFSKDSLVKHTRECSGWLNVLEIDFVKSEIKVELKGLSCRVSSWLLI
jgi:hypothetical protein